MSELTSIRVAAIAAGAAIVGSLVTGLTTAVGQYYVSGRAAEIQALSRKEIDKIDSDRAFMHKILSGSPPNSQATLCGIILLEGVGFLPNEWVVALAKNYEQQRGVDRRNCKGA